jgi:hypothetical protein
LAASSSDDEALVANKDKYPAVKQTEAGIECHPSGEIGRQGNLAWQVMNV